MKSKRSKLPVADTNKVVLFCSSSRYDTPLDTISIQTERIYRWCKEQNLEVVEVIEADESDTLSQLDKALHHAKNYGGRVVVASTSRISYDTLTVLKLRENLIAPLSVIDYDNISYTGELVDNINFMLSIETALNQKYWAECKEWVK